MNSPFSQVSDHLRKTESKAAEQRRKRVEADREKKRQEKKLNYLITRTELYSHFMSNRVNTSDATALVDAAAASAVCICTVCCCCCCCAVL